MKFEIAVAAVLAAEKLASSGVAADRSINVQEQAKLRNEAINAVSKRNPTGQRRSLSEGRQTKKLQDRLRDISQKNLRQLKGTIQKEQFNKDRSNLISDTLDLGILPLKTPGKEESKGSIKRLMNALNLDKESSSGSSLPDLGIFSKGNDKDNRRLQVNGNFDAENLTKAPVGYMVSNLCIGAQQSPYCDVCRVNFNDPLNPAAGYSVYIDCATPPDAEAEANNGYIKNQFDRLCDYGLCEGGCDIHPNEFKIEMKDCTIAKLPGVAEELEDILPDENGDLADLLPDNVSAFNTTHPLASLFENSCTQINAKEASGSEYCTACSVNSLDKIGEIAPYDVILDCPKIPEDMPYFFNMDEIRDICAYGMCETCEFQESKYNFQLRNCSLAFTGYDNIVDFLLSVNGSGNKGAEQLGNIIEGYFDKVCNSDDIVCGKCGPNEDSDSIISFDFDCPAVLSLPDGGFASYLRSAASFCTLQSYYGIKCGTCEVNPFEATFKIDDCVPLTDAENIFMGDVSSALSDEITFTLMYTQYCRPEAATYLQDTLDVPSCTCTFDSVTNKASLSCLHREKCQDFPSYCDEQLQMCDIYQISASLTQNGPINFDRCYNASFSVGNSDPDPYQFHYCLNYGAISLDGTQPRSYCEMEVQGLRCNSCSLDVNVAQAIGLGYDPNGILAATTGVSSKVYDCSNTVLGKTGSFSFYGYQLLENTLAYVSYQSLPCVGGCDLCGDGKRMFMSNPDGKFTAELWKDNTEDTCFAAQLEALTLKQPLTDEQCRELSDVVREPCGCTMLESGAHSLGKVISSTNSIILTIAAASIAHMLLG